MTVYFEAINDNNKVQIDDTTSRLRLTRSCLLDQCTQLVGTKFCNPSGYSVELNVSYLVVFDIYLQGSESLISIKILDNNNTSEDANGAGLVGFQIIRHKYNNYRVYICNARYSTLDISKSEVLNKLMKKIKVYFWGTGQIANENYGLEIYNDKSERIFHSCEQVLDFVGVFTSYNKFNRTGDIPYINTNISAQKSIIVESLASMSCLWRSTQNISFGFIGLYTENGVYKMHPFAVEFFISAELDKWVPTDTTFETKVYEIDVVD